MNSAAGNRTSFWSIPKPKKLLGTAVLTAVTTFAGAVGGSIYTGTANTLSSSIVTQGELDKVAANCSAALSRVEKTEQVLGTPTPVEARKSLADRLRDESDFARKLDLWLRNETRNRVGFQVAQHVGMDPKRKKAAESAAVRARMTYDRLVKDYPPDVAAEKVLELEHVPR